MRIDRLLGADILSQYIFQRIQRAEHISVFCRIVNQRIGYLLKTHSCRKILVVPILTIGINGVTLNLICPIGPVDHSLLTKRFVHSSLGLTIEVIIRNLCNDAMSFLAPTKRRNTANLGQHTNQKKRDNTLHTNWIYFLNE